MKILLIQREGIDLHHTFFSSETSRLALRFYHPKKIPCGVYITVATLGSALSLVSEMRWYIRRYVRETLFEVETGIFCTQTLAQDVYYERTAILGKTWTFRRLYGFAHGKLARQIVMSPGSVREDYSRDLAGTDTTIEVWCTKDEVEDIGEPIPLEDAGELPGAGDKPEP
jgi:Family of unknown function (DUF5804)